MQAYINTQNQNSFSKQAHTYQQNALVQTIVATKLLSKLESKAFDSVIDIGCGSGNLAFQIQKARIEINQFTGIDISKEMLNHHPQKLKSIKNITLICEDFEKFFFQKYNLAIAASSLQWAKDLDLTLSKIASSCSSVAFGIHTDKSLSSVHQFLGTTSPLRSKKTLQECLEKYFIGEMWIESLEQNFHSRPKLLKHLKNSGLLGGGVLGYTKAKYLKNYIPYEKIEYEVVMFVGKPKAKP